MLGNAVHWQQLSLKLSVLIKPKTNRFLKSVLSLLPLILITSPALAAESVLGIVKSTENQAQWSEITDRLQRVGIDYCIIDSSSWQEESDLGNISVILLPNVSNINGVQTQSLQQWMNRGGKAIVTGPTGNSSQTQIRYQLRSLFGAYWGFSLSDAATLELSQNIPVEWYGRPQLSHTLTGGALIPVGIDSRIAAVWLGENETAAAIVNENTTFLGWRWGYDAVAPATLDAAWLQAALNRYGISTYGKFSPVTNSQAKSCRSNILPQEESRPFLPKLQPILERSQSLLQQPYLGFRVEPALSAAEVQSMTQELQGLIGRFETTLLTADAYHSNLDISTSQAIQQLLSQKAKSSKQGLEKKSQSQHNKNAHQALKEAKDGLKRFRSLVDIRSYSAAKQQWSQAKDILWENYPTDRQLAQPEVRAMWLDRGTIVKAKSEADLAKIFDRMATAGINLVFFETVNAGYTMHPSKIAPEQNPLVKGWNPLEAAVKLAHERGMELHAWVWTFAAVNQRHNIILERPRHHLGPVLSRNPDWAMSDRSGNRFHYTSGKVFFDPANPGVKNYLSLLIEEIATDYDVDGIHLDYIRYPFENPTGTITYGYGIESRRQFKELTGVDPTTLTPQDRLWSQWTEFRIEQIDSFVASVSQNLKQKRPDLILSTAVFPFSRSERLTKIQQHWEEWIEQEWIDVLVPMTYAQNTEKLDRLTSPLLSQFDRGKALLLPGIRLLNISEVVAIDQMQLLRGMSTEGYALFAAENLNADLETVFNRTQGNLLTESREPLPHREPFQVTWQRYKRLQQEWNFFLTNHQLSVEDLTLKEWGEGADRLAEDLQKLADEPSVKHFLSTQLSLSSLRRKFPQWMKETKNIQPHQAQVWQNRLNTLDRLLSYGEKRVLNSDAKTVVR